MRFERGAGYTLVHGAPVPKGSDAITLGRFILMRKGVSSSRYLIYHELVHVRQWLELGVVRFGVRYIGDYLLGRFRGRGHWGAYHHIAAEIEADWHARRRLRDEAMDAKATV